MAAKIASPKSTVATATAPASTRGNHFDADMHVVPLASQLAAATSSADTSVSSVHTEPHSVASRRSDNPEPSSRRRVISPVSIAPPPLVDCHDAQPQPRPKQNNPYMYNVLGANASPDLAARTSPIPNLRPTSPTTAHTQQLSPLHNASYADVGSAFDEPWELPMRVPATAPAPPVLGGYMAACYSSAFPPGHLPAAVAQLDLNCSESTIPATATERSPTPDTTSSRTAVKSRRSRRQSKGKDNQPSPGDSPRISARETRSPSPPTSPVLVPGSPMTRVYRNGRPVPVPTAVADAH